MLENDACGLPPHLCAISVHDPSPDERLAHELGRVKAAGYDLVTAAIYVAKEFDGVHRLLAASAAFLDVCASEWGRPERDRKGRLRSGGSGD